MVNYYIFFKKNKVSQLFKTRNDRKLTIEILLFILVQLYSVVDDNFEMSNEQQINLENMLGDAFYEDLKCLPNYIINDLIGIYKYKLIPNNLICLIWFIYYLIKIV